MAENEKGYIWPEDPYILQRLEWFRDQKLALMMHWGPYSQWGIVESWALSDEDASWSRAGVDWETSGNDFKRDYFNLNKTFNPIRFRPELWADLAKDNGFKYLIFTTKHHDGFCMWDTEYSDYKITAQNCPFCTHRYADVCAHLFEAFRRRGLGIAAYFSKADWHTPYYWAKNQARGNFVGRNPTYNPEEFPKLWENFVEFTHNQVLELVKNYGKIDVLWFDAGQVNRAGGQDIRIEELIEKARKVQPWLLSADRTCGGICENYVTPEQCVPENPMDIPWESNVTMGKSFSFAYDDDYKSVKELIHLLIDVIAKGGNLALNVGPQPDGRLPKPAIERMNGIGNWLKIYGEAVYGTRACYPYRSGNFAFTQKEKEKKAFAFHMRGESAGFPEEIVIPHINKKVSRIENIRTGKTITFETSEKGYALKPDGGDLGAESIADAYILHFVQ
ncbi:MAG: alpha-L-fucosidase [Oscillospiraceae bacterium]|nr:alpha-L-fucosidase [Oscillospiraceae bacterium]